MIYKKIKPRLVSRGFLIKDDLEVVSDAKRKFVNVFHKIAVQRNMAVHQSEVQTTRHPKLSTGTVTENGFIFIKLHFAAAHHIEGIFRISI